MTANAARRTIPPIEPTIAGTRGTMFVLLPLGGPGVVVGIDPGPPTVVAPGVKNGLAKGEDADDSVDIEEKIDVADALELSKES